jgi:hypothetical protein
MGGRGSVEHPVPVVAGKKPVVDMRRIRHAANLLFVRFAKATSDSITGTSTSTPTTVARAAPEFRPKRPMATATASSKKV